MSVSWCALQMKSTRKPWSQQAITELAINLHQVSGAAIHGHGTSIPGCATSMANLPRLLFVVASARAYLSDSNRRAANEETVERQQKKQIHTTHLP